MSRATRSMRSCSRCSTTGRTEATASPSPAEERLDRIDDRVPVAQAGERHAAVVPEPGAQDVEEVSASAERFDLPVAEEVERRQQPARQDVRGLVRVLPAVVLAVG